MTVKIYKDGELKVEFTNQKSDLCALKWLLDNQSNSCSHAIKYGGYKVEVTDEYGQVTYWKPY